MSERSETVPPPSADERTPDAGREGTTTCAGCVEGSFNVGRHTCGLLPGAPEATSPVPSPSSPTTQRPFDEQALREEIVRVWGPAGAHVDLFDTILRQRAQAVEMLREEVRHSIKRGREFAARLASDAGEEQREEWAPSQGEPTDLTWRCRAQRSHGTCLSVNSAEDETCGACGNDRPATPSAGTPGGEGAEAPEGRCERCRQDLTAYKQIAALRRRLSEVEAERNIANADLEDACRDLSTARLQLQEAKQDSGIVFTMPPSGLCPVQAEGTIDGEPFYFRARGETVSIEVGPGNTAAVVAALPKYPDTDRSAADAVGALDCWRYEEHSHDWPMAGYVSEEFARAWIALAAVRYREHLASRSSGGTEE